MPTWVILSSVVSLSDSDSAAELDLRDPPEVVVLTIPKRILPENTTCVSVVAAGYSSILLHADHCPSDPTGTVPSDCYVLLDTTCTFSMHLSNHEFIMPPGYLGLLDSPMGGDYYMVVELQPPIDQHKQATLLCFCNNKWERKRIDYPLKSRALMPSGVISHSDRLWWVDLSWCIITCDPFDSKVELTSVDLPVVLAYKENWEGMLEKQRYVGFSCGKLRFVDMYMNINKQEKEQITMWTLQVTGGSMNWLREHSITFEKLWNHATYKRLDLPMVLPTIAFVDITDSNVIYLYLEEKRYIFGIDMRTGEMVEGHSHKPLNPPCKQFANHFIQPWMLVPYPQTLHIDDINVDLPSPEYWSSNSDEPMQPLLIEDQFDNNNESDESDESTDEGECVFLP